MDQLQNFIIPDYLSYLPLSTLQSIPLDYAVAIAFLTAVALVLFVKSYLFELSGQQEPLLIRSWIPYFGHELSFLRDQRQLFEWAK